MFTWKQVYCLLRHTRRLLVLKRVPVENQDLVRKKALFKDSIFRIDFVYNNAVNDKRTVRESSGKKQQFAYQGRYCGRTTKFKVVK